jgi:hypothetical protein
MIALIALLSTMLKNVVRYFKRCFVRRDHSNLTSSYYPMDWSTTYLDPATAIDADRLAVHFLEHTSWSKNINH